MPDSLFQPDKRARIDSSPIMPTVPDISGSALDGDGTARFRGIPIERNVVQLANHRFIIFGLKDASDLLNEPDFASEFVDHDRAPYGLELWPASKMLARRIIEEDMGLGRPALELGCGLGLVSIAAAARGWQATATDRDPVALQFARQNASFNGADALTFEQLDWSTTGSNATRCFDRVVAADVLYEKRDHLPVLACIDAHLSANGMAIVADPQRSVADRFPDSARDRGFLIDITEAFSEEPEGRIVHGRIFTLKRY